jgi:hypothetical protein
MNSSVVINDGQCLDDAARDAQIVVRRTRYFALIQACFAAIYCNLNLDMWHLLGIQVMGMTTRVETADELERRH